MKALLLYTDSDLDEKFQSPWNDEDLIADLGLETLFKAMALDDTFVYEVVKKVITSSISNDQATILYRQKILQDCLDNPAIIQEIYDLSVDAINSDKKIYWGIFSRYPAAILGRSIAVMKMYSEALRKLRTMAENHKSSFRSEGFLNMFNMLIQELSDPYLDLIQENLKELKFPYGLLMSAELGRGNKGKHYVLRKTAKPIRNLWDMLFSEKPQEYSYSIDPRDDAGARALTELKDRGINAVANALAQSCDHIQNFFKMLQTELAFYLGCLHLHETLKQLDEPVTYPVPAGIDERRHTFEGLYDICLALTLQQKVVGNDLAADKKDLFVITGANQGGKSTFLRSIGLAQLMMHSGMYVAAQSFSANICDGLFTHYKREEDSTMSSGKLDEELSRMNDIVNHITQNPLLLFNESFAATNEREGSEIAGQITRALLEDHVKIFFVSHLYDFTHGLYQKGMQRAVFLRAERQEDGTRTFHLVQGEPLQTSFGKDLYVLAQTGQEEAQTVNPLT